MIFPAPVLPEMHLEAQLAHRTTLGRLLERITYKPGWSFRLRMSTFPTYNNVHIFPGYVDSPVLDIKYPAPDSCKPSESREFVVHMPINPFLIIEETQYDERFWIQWLVSTILDVERHELDEFLRLDGELFHDPHADDLVRQPVQR